ncbi:MAG: sulfurtransferase complex subunit TusB [Pseudomonadota bacterium]|jgi:tRNA 2-thiouridine synthesizing protein B
MLHLIFQSPISAATLARIDSRDAIIFFENAIFSLVKQTETQQMISTFEFQHLFVLITEIQRRGLSPDQLIEGIQCIDYITWVNLTIEHRLIQTWR